MPGDAMWRQQVEATARKQPARSFDAVVQKRGDQLLMLALAPTGQKLFAARLDGRRVSSETFPGAPTIRIDPARMLLDFQRAFFPVDADVDAPADGVRRVRLRGETVVETFAAGRLVERRFGSVSVRYSDWSADGTLPRRVHLADRRTGYELRITTIEWQRL